MHAAPGEPVVGDVVEVDVQITNLSGGVADIPLFQLVGAEPLFAIEAQDNSYPQVAFARYWLRAVAPGLATLRLSVNFETTYGCADVPSFVFHPVRSPPYAIAVRGEALTASVTPTATPTPQRAAPMATGNGPLLTSPHPVANSQLDSAAWFAPSSTARKTTCLRCPAAHESCSPASPAPIRDRRLAGRGGCCCRGSHVRCSGTGGVLSDPSADDR